MNDNYVPLAQAAAGRYSAKFLAAIDRALIVKPEERTPSIDVLDAIRGRRSAVRYGDGPVPRAVLEQIVEAARWAPNHHLTEPWRFVVLTGQARAALGDAIATEILQNPANPKAEAEATGVRTKVMRSPVIIAVGQVRVSSDPEKDLEDYAACACAKVLSLSSAREKYSMA